MPFSYRRDDSRRCVVMVGSGVVNLDEWAAALARHVNEGIWRYASLWDFTAVADLNGFDDHDVLRDIQEMVAHHGTRGPVALVATASAVYERFKAFAGSAADLPYQTRAFRDADLAAEWLEGQQAGVRDAF